VQPQQRLKVAQRQRAPVGAQCSRRLAGRVGGGQARVRPQKVDRLVQPAQRVHKGRQVGLRARQHDRLQAAWRVQVVQRALGGGQGRPHLVPGGAQGLEEEQW
jgi:hypothetical protein